MERRRMIWWKIKRRWVIIEMDNGEEKE